jgi:hypothetical protein
MVGYSGLMELTINGVAPDENDSLDEGERTQIERQKARDSDIPNPKPRKKNPDAVAVSLSTGRKGKNKTKQNKKKAEGSSKEDQESPSLPEGVQGCVDRPCECPSFFLSHGADLILLDSCILDGGPASDCS